MIDVKLIIAGGRDFTDYIQVFNSAKEFVGPAELTIISGMARGADMLGVRLAQDYGLDLIEMPANWDSHGRSAGYIRNAAMAREATHLLAFWDGSSRGTANMIQVGKAKGLTVKVIKY